MRKPDTVEKVYIDFDGFFASVEQQAQPALRERPVGIVPFPDTVHTCIIAASKEAKMQGVKTGMNVLDAKNVCPDIALIPQRPDLYVRAHHALINSIENILPIEAICSIDELTCSLDTVQHFDPASIGEKIKTHLKESIGSYITCSIGFAPNRQLAKIASDMNKPDGLTILSPENLPGPLLELELQDLPGIGKRMARRLWQTKIYTVQDLWDTQPKHLRAIWRNVNGERFWYALHGYTLEAAPTERRMFGHSRVLPPEWRTLIHAYACARLLLTKAARRMRRAQFLANKVWLTLVMERKSWHKQTDLPSVSDDYSCLEGLTQLWQQAKDDLPSYTKVKRLGVALYELNPASERQLDFFNKNNRQNQKWKKMSQAVDELNTRYGKTIVSIGPWVQPPGGYAGGKIAYARIPDEEDFW